MMADHFFGIAHDRDDVTFIDYTILLKDPIPPDSIINHYCPKRIKDPYKYRVWNDEAMRYE